MMTGHLLKMPQESGRILPGRTIPHRVRPYEVICHATPPSSRLHSRHHRPGPHRRRRTVRLTVSLILLQAQHVQRAEPSQRIPGPSILALSVIGLGLAIALLAYGVYNHDAAAVINLPAAGILLYVIVSQYAHRQRKPTAQPVFISAPEAPLAEIGGNLPQ